MRKIFLIAVLLCFGCLWITGCGKNVEKAKDAWNLVMSEGIAYEVDTSSIKDVNTPAEMKAFMKDTLPLFLASEKKSLQYVDKCEKYAQITQNIHQMLLSNVNKQNESKIISDIKKFKEQQNDESIKMADELLEDAKLLAGRPVPKDAQPFYAKAINTLQLNRKLILEYAEKNTKICDLKLDLLTKLEDNSKDVERSMDYVEKVNVIVKDFKESHDKIMKQVQKEQPTKEEIDNFNKTLKNEIKNFTEDERAEYAKLIKNKGLEEFFPSLFGDADTKRGEIEKKELSLGNIYIGQSFHDVASVLGNPLKKSEPNEQGQIQYKFPDINVSVTDGIVTGFVSENANFTTKRGVKQGDSLDKVIAQYGDKPYGNSQYGDTILYEYKFISDKGDDCLLRFAIKDGVVDYISGRVLNMGSQNMNRHQ